MKLTFRFRTKWHDDLDDWRTGELVLRGGVRVPLIDFGKHCQTPRAEWDARAVLASRNGERQQRALFENLFRATGLQPWRLYPGDPGVTIEGTGLMRTVTLTLEMNPTR